MCSTTGDRESVSYAGFTHKASDPGGAYLTTKFFGVDHAP
jgi:hypothetical protein